jgi:hypothetical protein
MKEILISAVFGYVLISWIVAIYYLLRLIAFKMSKDESRPVLTEDYIKTNIKVFALGLWLPYFICRLTD